MTEERDIREVVRQRYAESARQLAVADGGGCGDGGSCCGSSALDGNVTTGGTVVFGSGLYTEAESEGAAAAVEASLGCGVPTAVADLRDGDVVLDLGSGAGADVLISARRVGPSGRAIGLDMTTEMLELARKNAAEAGVTNVEFLQGYLEEVPLPDGAVDVVISNCVINLAADKDVVLAEASRVTRPGGLFAVSDVNADVDLDDATRADLAAYTGCIAGALTEEDYRAALTRAGWTEVEVRPTHRVHEHAQAAIIRAVRA
jgi:SAM-dependent methyltransferase